MSYIGLIDDDDGNFKPADNWLRIKRDDPSLTNVAVYAHRYARNQLDRLAFWLLSLNPRNNLVLTTTAEIEELGRDIGNNTHLVRLVVMRDNIDESRRIFQLLCEGINQNRSINRLHLNNQCGREGLMFQFLNPFLENNNNLQQIIVHVYELNSEGLCLLMAPLMRRGTPLDLLALYQNSIDDGLVEELVAVFLENPALTPKNLNLRHNNFGRNGIDAIARLLRDPRCTMEGLDLSGNHINNDSAIILADGLVRNNKLRKLNLDGTLITTAGFGFFSPCLCNRSSINATFSSNHTLQFLGHFYTHENVPADVTAWIDYENPLHPMPADLQEYLEWNTNENKKIVARQKVFMQHFIRDFRMQAFEGMDPDLLVSVLNFMDRASSENNGVSNINARHSILIRILSQVLNNSLMIRTKLDGRNTCL